MSATAAVAEYRIWHPTPETMPLLWEQFAKRRHLYPNGLAVDVAAFVDLMTAPDTVIYEMGDFEGVAYFTGVPDRADRPAFAEPSAMSHVLIWGTDYLKRADVARAIARDVMGRWQLRRLLTEIPAFNKMAVAFAKRVGFKEVGILRARHNIAGAWEASVVLDALASDLKEASHG